MQMVWLINENKKTIIDENLKKNKRKILKKFQYQLDKLVFIKKKIYPFVFVSNFF